MIKHQTITTEAFTKTAVMALTNPIFQAQACHAQVDSPLVSFGFITFRGQNRKAFKRFRVVATQGVFLDGR